MKKTFDKMKVRIDQNLNRSEKTLALSPEMEKIEETMLAYKQVCTTVHKKLCDYIPNAGKGTDGQPVERRLKKTADFMLGQSLSDQGRVLTKQQSSSCLGQVLLEAGGLCTSIGTNLVQYEISVEQLVIQQLETVLKTDLPSISKQRKHLDQLVLELDTAKARLATAQQEEKQAGVISGAGKVEKCIEELDDIDRRVEIARDTLATDMMTFLAKDAQLAGVVSRFLDYKLEYHTSLADQVKMVQPKLDTVLDSRRGYPIFGTSLANHLSSFCLPSGIAFPIQLCVSRLMALGLEEEGLFRLAAGNSKVKRLKAEIETPGLNMLACVETTDHHVLTAIIKCYLRELPEPLFGAGLYQDWLEAGQCEDNQERMDAVWNLLQHDQLQRINYKNIQYFFKFLHEVSLLGDRNKMSASNLAIVITPNVIWECEEVSDPMDVGVNSSLARVVELIISQYNWFFQNDASLHSWDHQLPAMLQSNFSLPPSPPPTDYTTLATPQSAKQSTSPLPNTRERKGKVKKAPMPPGGDLSSPLASPSHSRSGTGGAVVVTIPPSPSHTRSNIDTGGAVSPRSNSDAGGHNSHPVSVSEPRSMSMSEDRPELCRDHSPSVGWSGAVTNGAVSSHPVPAPRTIKPAIPNKPEGISRNASMRVVDNQPRLVMDKESTNL